MSAPESGGMRRTLPHSRDWREGLAWAPAKGLEMRATLTRFFASSTIGLPQEGVDETRQNQIR